MASHSNTANLNEDDALPPPPQGSELFARLNIGDETSKSKHTWIAISSHTAKCDLCLEHNKSVCQRCSNCNRQLCRKCIHTAHGDGIHSFNEANLNWTPAAPIKRGPRAQASSTIPLRITSRRTNAPSAARAHGSTSFRVFKRSSQRIQTRAQAAQTVSGARAHGSVARRSTLSGTKRGRSGSDDSNAPSSKKSKTQEALSTPEVVVKAGNTFFAKPTGSQNSGKVTIKINGGMIVKAGSGTKTNTSNGRETTTTTTSTSPTSSSTISSSSIVTSSTITATSTSPNGDGDDDTEDEDNSKDGHKHCAEDAPMQEAQIKVKTEAEKQKEIMEKKAAWETNPILLSLQSEGKYEEAATMLEIACTMLNLSQSG